MDGAFSQLTILGASAMLLCGFVVLGRRGVPAYVSAFAAQSMVLACVTAVVAHYGQRSDLYWIAGVLLILKGIAIPGLLRRMERRFRAERELEPYVNTATSLVLAGMLVLLGYVISRPLVALSRLPTRAGMPLAMGLVLVSLFVLVSRKKAITQVIGFLMLENALALLAVLGTYGIPLIVELGVFLDALLGFLVMQIFVYQIHETFESMDVERLSRLRH
jgi:hydrogenase-4 component E